MIIIKATDKLFTLYLLKFPDNKVYVGITSQKLYDRWKGGKAYKTQLVGKAIEKFGWDNVEKIVIAENLDVKTAKEKEKEYIAKYSALDGVYNISEGGECGSLLTSEFELDGRVYSSREIAEMSSGDISYHDITTRVNHHGWDLEKAMTQEKMDKNQRVEYKGNEYSFKELLQFAKLDELTERDLRTRIVAHGWDVERALSQPKDVKLQPHGVGERKYFYDGKWCNSYDLYLLRKDKNITQASIVSRIKRSHWDIEKAISKPPKVMDRKYTYKGKEYSSKELEAISPHGLLYNTIVSRIKKGWSVEDAVETPSGEKPSK